MDGNVPYEYEASDESSESELFDRSLSLWRGWSGLDAKEKFTPMPIDLHTACSIGLYDRVRQILSRNLEDLNRKNCGGWTPLMYACYIGHELVVNLLLEAQVGVSIRNHQGCTPLMLAASCGNEVVGYHLIKHGADIEAFDNMCWTALFHATHAGHQNMVKFLLDGGANHQVKEPSQGLTPFMLAAMDGHEILVQLFLQHNVNVEVKSISGDTARSLALMKGHIKIVSLIENYILGSKNSLRSEAGLESDFSSSDEYSRRSVRQPCIKDGPKAISKMLQQRNSKKKSRNSSETHFQSETEETEDVLSLTAINNSLPVAKDQQSLSVQSLASGVNQPADLNELLLEIGLEKYLPELTNQDIDLHVFLSLSDQDLKDVGVSLFGPRRKMLNAIKRWHVGKENTCGVENSPTLASREQLLLNIEQEKQLRFVAEGWLVEARNRMQLLHNLAADTRHCCGLAANHLCNIRLHQEELETRLREPDHFQQTELVAAIQTGMQLEPSNILSRVSTQKLTQNLHSLINDLEKHLMQASSNADKMLGRDVD